MRTEGKAVAQAGQCALVEEFKIMNLQDAKQGAKHPSLDRQKYNVCMAA